MEIFTLNTKGAYKITTPTNKDDLICAVPLNADIAFKFIVPNSCGGVAVGIDINTLKTFFQNLALQIGNTKISVNIVGGDDQPSAREYFSKLSEEFSSVGKELGLEFDITSKVNADIHPNYCSLRATELIGAESAE